MIPDSAVMKVSMATGPTPPGLEAVSSTLYILKGENEEAWKLSTSGPSDSSTVTNGTGEEERSSVMVRVYPVTGSSEKGRVHVTTARVAVMPVTFSSSN